MISVPYAKMNGAGNSILVVDLRAGGGTLSGETARRLGDDPRFRFDQLMAIGPARTPGTDAFVDIFNIDGSRAGACGNGTRCVAFVLTPTAGREIVVETAAGPLPCRQLAETRFSVDMGAPCLRWDEIPLRDPVVSTGEVALAAPPAPAFATCSAVSMGNPHAVYFVMDTEAIDLAAIGPRIEHDPMFPDRVNVSVAEILSPEQIRLRTWERGAGATLACGSAACATVVAAVRAGLTSRATRVILPGGELEIAWREIDGHVIMTGDVELEHEGFLSLEPGEAVT